MQLDTFFDNFELLADAPNSVQKLREMILQLAVQGKLLPQDPKDEPADVLIKKISVTKKWLMRENKIKNIKPLPSIEPNEIPYRLPIGWNWSRLGSLILSIKGGGTPSKRNPDYWGGKIPWASVKDLGANKYLENTKDSITKLGLNKSSSNLIPIGNVIICTRMGLGKIVINNIDVAINQDLKAILLPEEIEIHYFYNYYLTQNIVGSGMTVNGIRQENLLKMLAPIPPLNEQKRIVAKVDELMALCDKLEARKQQVSTNSIQLNNASIHKLLKAREPKKFSNHWQRICDNFDLLYSKPENVTKLRQAILQLAVQGKLVPQDPKDEPAPVLLEKIKAKKERLIKENKIKKPKPLPPIKSDEILYELPNGWEWTRLAAIGLINPRNEINDETEVSFVPMKLVPTVLGDQVESEIRKWEDIKSGFTHFAEGDVALAKITPCFQNRKSAVMRGLKNGLGAGTTELHIFRPINNLIISEYILLYLNTPKFIREGVSKMTGSAGQKRVPKTYFSETPFPLAPTNEQKRIVAKIDELMALCDELEASLSQSQTDCDKLMEAAVAKILAA